MKKIWVHKARSFKEAERFERKYYAGMTSTERLDTVQYLREIYDKFIQGRTRAGRKGLRRVIRIIQPA